MSVVSCHRRPCAGWKPGRSALAELPSSLRVRLELAEEYALRSRGATMRQESIMGSHIDRL